MSRKPTLNLRGFGATTTKFLEEWSQTKRAPDVEFLHEGELH